VKKAANTGSVSCPPTWTEPIPNAARSTVRAITMLSVNVSKRANNWNVTSESSPEDNEPSSCPCPADCVILTLHAHPTHSSPELSCSAARPVPFPHQMLNLTAQEAPVGCGGELRRCSLRKNHQPASGASTEPFVGERHRA